MIRRLKTSRCPADRPSPSLSLADSYRSLLIGPNIFREQSFEALRKTDLEWTQFQNGLFLDYFGIPHVESYLNPFVVFVDIAHRKAAIPGSTGDELVNLTYTKDLAKFVVASLSLEKWDQVLSIYSDQISIRQIVELAEEATGKGDTQSTFTGAFGLMSQ